MLNLKNSQNIRSGYNFPYVYTDSEYDTASLKTTVEKNLKTINQHHWNDI